MKMKSLHLCWNRSEEGRIWFSTRSSSKKEKRKKRAICTLFKMVRKKKTMRNMKNTMTMKRMSMIYKKLRKDMRSAVRTRKIGKTKKRTMMKSP